MRSHFPYSTELFQKFLTVSLTGLSIFGMSLTPNKGFAQIDRIRTQPAPFDLGLASIGMSQVFSNQSLPSYSYDDYDLDKYNRLYSDSRYSYDQAARNFERAQRDLDLSARQESGIQDRWNQSARLAEKLEAQARDLQKSIELDKATLVDVQKQLPLAQAAANSLQNQVASTNQVIADLKAKLAAAADADKPAIQAQIDSQTQVLATLTAQLNEKNQIVSQLNQKNSQAQSALAEHTSSLESANQQLNKAKSDALQLAQQLQSAHNEVIERTRYRDTAQMTVNSAARGLEIAQRNLETVQRNREQARYVLNQKGQADGSQDGQREGFELGSSRGAALGEQQGRQDGTRQGTADGKARDYHTGYASGRDQAIADATQASNVQGEADGRSQGFEQGKIDGLQAAYDLGKQEGLEHGQQTGDDTVAYAEGRKEGESDGLARAVSDAKPEFGIGYSEKEKEYLNAKLNAVVVGDPNLAEAFKGLQGRFSDEGEDRYYSPQPGMIPHPDLMPFYRDAYDNAYRSTLHQAYSQMFEQQRIEKYNSFRDLSYKQAFALHYQESEDSGRSQGRVDYYQKTYDQNYALVKAKFYKLVHDETFAKYQYDPAQRKSGFIDGNRIASRQKGYDEGFRDVYNRNIGLEKDKAHAAGVASAKNLYDNNPVIKVESISLKEIDTDGIYRPGENLSVLMKVKNYGLKSKTDLLSNLKNSAGSIIVGSSQVSAGVIPAQSDATVVVPVQAQVDPAAKDGSQLQITMRALSGTQVYKEQTVQLPVMYPAKVEIVGFDGVLVPGEKTNLNLKVINRSTKKQNLNLSLSVDGRKVDLGSQQIQVSDLAPKSSQQVSVILVGKPEARFEETQLDIQTAQASLAFAEDNHLGITIIRRHIETADSKGLILSSNLAVGSGKKMYSLDKMDTWDLRVDGSISDYSKLSGYQNKVIHILAEENAQADQATLSQLRSFMKNNGSVVIWGSHLDRSQIAQSLLPELGVSVVSTQNLSGTLIGLDRLKGFSVPASATVQQLKSENIHTSYVVNSQVGTVGLLTFKGATKEATGQILTMGIDPVNLENASLSSILAMFDLVRSSFENKLNLAQQDPNGKMYLVAYDMADELISAEDLKTGSFYKDNSKNNKIARAAKKFIGDDGRNSSQAKMLASFYPVIDKAYSMLDKEVWEAGTVIGQRYGGFFTSRNMKDIYCESNSGSAICQ